MIRIFKKFGLLVVPVTHVSTVNAFPEHKKLRKFTRLAATPTKHLLNQSDQSPQLIQNDSPMLLSLDSRLFSI